MKITVDIPDHFLRDNAGFPLPLRNLYIFPNQHNLQELTIDSICLQLYSDEFYCVKYSVES